MKKVIINADDFGINEVVTAEIERQILAERVSSTTVMANGACLDEVKCFAVVHPEVSFGVHLCLSEFDSVTKSEGLHRAGLTDERGGFVTKAIFGIRHYDNEALEAIRKELNAQIDMVENLGFPISHADSHHHVHIIYPLKELFSEVLKQRGIKKVRLGGDFRTWRMRLHLQKWLQRRQLNNYYRSEFKTADDFYSYSEFLACGMPVKDGQTIELMCHPGHPGLAFKKEIKKLEETSLPTDIKLISYNEL